MRNKLQQLQKDMKGLDVSKLQEFYKGEFYCLKDIVCDISDCDEYIYNILWTKYEGIATLIDYISSKQQHSVDTEQEGESDDS